MSERAKPPYHLCPEYVSEGAHQLSSVGVQASLAGSGAFAMALALEKQLARIFEVGFLIAFAGYSSLPSNLYCTITSLIALWPFPQPVSKDFC